MMVQCNLFFLRTEEISSVVTAQNAEIDVLKICSKSCICPSSLRKVQISICISSRNRFTTEEIPLF